MIQAQRIALTNSAGVALDFSASVGPFQASPATNLLLGQSATVELADLPFHAGATIRPLVVVTADARHSPPPEPELVQLTMNGRTQHYTVHGTIWDWTVTAGALDPPTGRPDLPGFPAQVPLNLLPYRNWDRQIVRPGMLTCAPLTADDVALVCNWAQDNGYQLRPRGVMHGWSPLTLTPTAAPNERVLLIDLTKGFAGMELLPAGDGLPTRVRVGAGATMLELLTFLEQQPGGKGSAPGYSFPHTPAPGDLTVGGVLAIGAHGTAVPTPPADAFAASYGSLSNQVVELTLVGTDPANPGTRYASRTLARGDATTKAVLAHLGRALVLEATLQVVDNYNLRCLSITDLPASTIFASPTASDPVPANSFADFLGRLGRVEVIWYPFSDNPWLHTWQVA
nr:cholesterol oxidase substrate-binding domain-containing protein [Micropruina sp.]